MVKDIRLILNNPHSNPHISEYYSLRDEIDRLCTVLEKTHKSHLVCAAGCHSCCQNFSIFPVEYYSIVNEISKREIKINEEAEEDECKFLISGFCSVYNSRPIICRTHGLPLLYMDDEGWQLSHCGLNFTGESPPEFSESNTFPQDRINSRLFLMNRGFIKTLKEKTFLEKDLIPLRQLSQ